MHHTLYLTRCITEFVSKLNSTYMFTDSVALCPEYCNWLPYRYLMWGGGDIFDIIFPLMSWFDWTVWGLKVTQILSCFKHIDWMYICHQTKIFWWDYYMIKVRTSFKLNISEFFYYCYFGPTVPALVHPHIKAPRGCLMNRKLLLFIFRSLGCKKAKGKKWKT